VTVEQEVGQPVGQAVGLAVGLTRPEPRNSPLGGWRAGSPDRVLLAEVPFLAMVNLRVDPAGPVAGRIAALLGVELPTEPNTVVSSPAWSVLWLGPDEWLVLGPDGAAPDLVELLRGLLAGQRGSAVDLSANRTTISLTGPCARDLLEQGCPLDLHPRVFGPGRCVQTMLARTQVVIWRSAQGAAGTDGVDGGADGEPGETFRLLVRGSFAGYLAAWLTDAAGEHWNR
jgi:sarcosine oxidase subunit gamma